MRESGRNVRFIGKQKYRFARGQGYISIINVMLLLGIAFHITNPFLIIIVGSGTLVAVWLVGYVDDKSRMVLAESDYAVEETTPFFKKLRNDLDKIRHDIDEIKKGEANEIAR